MTTKLHVPQKETRLYTPKEVAKKLGIAYPQVLKYMSDGELKYYELSRNNRRISEKHLTAFLKEREK